MTCLIPPGASRLLRCTLLLGLALAATSPATAAASHDLLNSVAASPDHAIYAVGVTSGALAGDDAHQGVGDGWLARFDTDGRRRWLRQFGAATGESAVGVAAVGGGTVWVLTHRLDDTRSDSGILHAFDAAGTALRTLTLAPFFPTDHSLSVAAVAVDAAGNPVVVGTVRYGGDRDAFILALNPQGELRWLRRLGGDEQRAAFAVALGSVGEVYVGGHSLAGDKDIWLARYDADGTLRWLRTWGGAHGDVATGIAADADRGVLVSGYTSSGKGTRADAGTTDIWLARLGAGGEWRWLRQWRGHGPDLATTVAVDGNGNAYVVGSVESRHPRSGEETGRDAAVTAFDRTGERLWQRRTGHAGRERARGIAVGADGQLYVGGDRNDDHVNPADDSGHDAWLARLDGDGRRVWRRAIESGPGLAGNSGHGTATTATTVHYSVTPAQADPGSSQWQSPHQIWRPATLPAADRLVLFLPGSGATPAQYSLLLQHWAARGHAVIGLSYPNTTAVGRLCEGQFATAGCFGQVRQEILTGEDANKLVTIPPQESVFARLSALLTYLEAEHPADGWGRWLADGAPVWANIVVTGHSQGGGHAALIGKQVAVARVVMLAATEDTAASGLPATWITDPGVTATARYFGFDHSHDPFWESNLANWSALGLNQHGALVDVDGAGGSFAASRRLYTAMTPATGINHGGDPHDSVAVDAFTPLHSDGTPWYALDGTWAYLLGQ